MNKILLTGFEPFADVSVNPSQLIVEHFAARGRPDIATAVLPVSYEATGEHIKARLREHQPDAVVMLGVAPGQTGINLERIAVNMDDDAYADNRGVVRSGEQIVKGGAVGYWSTLPLEAMHEAIMQAEIPVQFSNHAATYLCNHVFYVALHSLNTSGHGHVACGFIHLPGLDAMAIETQIRAIEVCLNVVMNRQVTENAKN